MERMSSMGLAPYCQGHNCDYVVKIEMPGRKTCRTQLARSENEALPNIGINIRSIPLILFPPVWADICLFLRDEFDLWNYQWFGTTTFKCPSGLFFWLPTPFTLIC
jgi:hypothetical protein